MNIINIYWIGFMSIFMVMQSQAQQKATLPGDFADPSVIAANGKYYSVGTSSEWGPHFPIYSSTDMHSWKQEGFVFEETPDWAGASFWAPEYYYHQGKYYLYYSAKRKSDGVSCIGLAISNHPDRGFVDQGVVVDYGTESIDAYVIQEGDELYMTWKAYGLDQRPIELLASKMSADGKSLIGDPISLLQDSARIGIEGQSFVKKDGYYYMFYSAGACCGPGCDYHVQAVRSRSVLGPYERVGEAVLLGQNDDWTCMGHGTFATRKDGKLYYLFHGYNKNGHENTGRQGLLAELLWSDKGMPVFNFIPANKTTKGDFEYDFTKLKNEKIFWQWDFKYTKPSWSFGKQGLRLTGAIADGNRVGASLTFRPNVMNYSFATTLNLEKTDANTLHGLVIYGDHERAIGIGVKGNKLIFWQVQEGNYEQLDEQKLNPQLREINIQMRVKEDKSCKAYYLDVDRDWKVLSSSKLSSFSLSQLAPWDRSPRFGLHMSGDSNAQAVFKSFKYKEE